jgi:hypothetical protein
MTIPPPPAEAAAQTLARDARRIRWLTGLTVFLWLIVVAAVALLLGTYNSAIAPKQRMMLHIQDELAAPEARASPEERQKLERKLFHNTAVYAIAVSMGTALLAVTVGVLALACLGTVLLVFATRRATLRQIQVSLADISAQLAALRQSLPSSPGGGMRTGEGSR